VASPGVADPLGGREGREPRDVARVGELRVRRRAALEGEEVVELLEPERARGGVRNGRAARRHA
jgi:hypothetical protein